MKSLDIRLTDKEKRNQVLLCLYYKGLKIIVQGVFYLVAMSSLFLSLFLDFSSVCDRIQARNGFCAE